MANNGQILARAMSDFFLQIFLIMSCGNLKKAPGW
jgi:hypothetical protein